MKLAIPAVLAVALLGGCALTPSNSGVVGVLTQISNTATADLNSQIAVADAATPPDTAGAACGQSALTVAAAIQKVMAVLPTGAVAVPATATTPAVPAVPGATVGAFTAAEIATLYAPGSPQFNWAVTTLETGCIAKIHQTNVAINSTAGIIAAIPTVLVLAALPAGA